LGTADSDHVGKVTEETTSAMNKLFRDADTNLNGKLDARERSAAMNRLVPSHGSGLQGGRP
jgi:hypothetical protein